MKGFLRVYLSHIMHKGTMEYVRTTKAQASLYISAVSPEPLLLAYIKYGPGGSFRPKVVDLAPS